MLSGLSPVAGILYKIRLVKKDKNAVERERLKGETCSGT